MKHHCSTPFIRRRAVSKLALFRLRARNGKRGQGTSGVKSAPEGVDAFELVAVGAAVSGHPRSRVQRSSGQNPNPDSRCLSNCHALRNRLIDELLNRGVDVP
jgi:hypothetical protein